MYRRTFPFCMAFAEARRLFFGADGAPLAAPRAELPTVLKAIQANYRPTGAAHTPSMPEREALVVAALQHVVMLDGSNDDSALLAAWTEAAEAGPTMAGAPAEGEAGAAGKPVHTVVQLMRVFPNSIPIRERCCRCIANMCQLGNTTSPHTASPSTGAEGAMDAASMESQHRAAHLQSLSSSLAERLVQEGAVEQAVGTLRAVRRLSRRGRCWAALAVLNLTCLSRSGAARAAAAGGEEALSEFILFLLDEATSVDGVLRDEDGLAAIALDAALGGLAGVLAAEAPENDQRVSYNYEKISYTAVSALVRALLATSLVVVRDGRNNGAYNASLPNRRAGVSVSFAIASPLQQGTVAVMLPQLHKGWMALQHAASHTANLPVLFDALYEAANANQESGGRVPDGDDTAADTEEVLQVSAETERRYVAALNNLLEAALFLVTELEGLAEVSPELARLQRDLSLSVTEVMAAMTNTRRSPPVGRTQEQARVDDGPGEGAATAPGEGGDGAEVAASALPAAVPTSAALGVVGVLASGLVSSMALATAVRLHTEHQILVDGRQRELRQQARRAGEGGHRAGSDCPPPVSASPAAAAVLTPYDAADFALLSKAITVLSNLSETEDEVATSANTVAALQAMLQDAADLVKAFPTVYDGDIASLFRPREQDVDGRVVAPPAGERVVAAEHRLSLLQHLALVGQVFAVLSSVLRTPQGVSMVSELDVLSTATDVQRSLVDVYGAAIRQAKERYSGEGVEGGKSQAWVATTAQESVERLATLGEQLIVNLNRLAGRPSAAEA